MLEYDVSYSSVFITDEELSQYNREHAGVLRDVQSGCSAQRESAGWIDTDEWASDAAIEKLTKLNERVCAVADTLILVGVGGSNQAARAVAETLGSQKKRLNIIYAGNSTSPSALVQALEEAEGRSVFVNIIAKNFETLEPGAAFRVLRAYLAERYGQDAGKRIIATGTRGSSLEKLSKEQGYEFLTFPENIGGRFSALSDVGLFPMAAAGADIRAIVRGARDMRELLMHTEADNNPAMRYASVRNLLERKGYKIEMLSFFDPGLRWLAQWWAQLFGESEGKDGKGVFPTAGQYSEGLHSIGQFMQEGSPVIMETFLHVLEQDQSLIVKPDGIADGFGYLDGKTFAEINNAALQATLHAHAQRLPCGVLTIDRIDEYHFGQMFYFFEFACTISAKLLGVNPFDQPGVEEYKRSMFALLGKK
jgi:glucose-6-phosphate isomerase